MYYVVFRYVKCPSCGAVVRRGVPRFGPREAACANCGALLQTGLTPWGEMPFRQKLGTSLFELLAPSRLGKPLYALILQFAFLFVLCSASIGAFLAKTVACGWLLFATMLLLGTVWPAVRLIRLIRESNEYTRTGVPPSWKGGM